MKALLAMALFTALALLGTTQPAQANCGSVCELKPFTAQTHFMSIAGYERWQHFQQAQTWTPWHEVVATTKSQLRACPVSPEHSG
ncbi:MAG: hypothetical protein ACYDBB_24370 [Armatimonadota bacterium]